MDTIDFYIQSIFTPTKNLDFPWIPTSYVIYRAKLLIAEYNDYN